MPPPCPAAAPIAAFSVAVLVAGVSPIVPKSRRWMASFNRSWNRRSAVPRRVRATA